jgi:hypothetical protein
MTPRSWLAVAAAAAAGCGDPAPVRVAVHPVRGQLFVDGKPADGAYVVFTAAGPPVDGRRPAALVGPGGTFRPNFYDVGDGAPEGEYALTVYWPVSGMGMAPDRLKGRYADPAKPVARVTVKPGDNLIDPIRLK